MTRRELEIKGLVGAGLAVLGIGILYYISDHNYLLFHGIIELAAATIGFLFLAVALNLYPLSQSSFLAILAIGFAWAGGIDIIHTLAYRGVGVFAEEYGANLPTQLWIVARYLQAGGVFLATWFVARRTNPFPLLGGFGVVAAGLLVAVFSGLFPAAYVEGEGLTTFKVASEYAVIVVLLVALGNLYRQRGYLDAVVFRYVFGAVVVSMAAELAFTLYVDVYGLLNFAGHILKLVAYLLVYRVIVYVMLHRPIEALTGFIPICANCKSVRGDQGSWEPLESYFGAKAGASFSHGLCPECEQELYGDLASP